MEGFMGFLGVVILVFGRTRWMFWRKLYNISTKSTLQFKAKAILHSISIPTEHRPFSILEML